MWQQSQQAAEDPRRSAEMWEEWARGDRDRERVEPPRDKPIEDWGESVRVGFGISHAEWDSLTAEVDAKRRAAWEDLDAVCRAEEAPAS